MSAWRVSVRSGPRVARLRAATLAEALDTLEAETRAAATAEGRRGAVNLRYRRFEPADQVAVRAEVRGPGRWRPAVRAGLDVRGDGTVEAWTGGVRRRRIEPADGDSAYDALRRAVQSVNVEP
jgi:hypothetical protein